MVFGNVILIDFAVVFARALFLTSSLKLTAFGLDLVPAFEGEPLPVASMLGVVSWA